MNLLQTVSRHSALAAAVAGAVLGGLAAFVVSPWWWTVAAPCLLLTARGLYDLKQRRHSILRNYPLLGHLRFWMEFIRPEVRQYFGESNLDGRPFPRDLRSLVYQRAKGETAQKAFGTEWDVYRSGHEFFVTSMAPVPVPDGPMTVRVGGPDCRQPYDMPLLNISAMSFGALSAPAIQALSQGASEGGFAHDTGEGGLSSHHLVGGADLIWQIGTGYFGCRTDDGRFDEDKFAVQATHPRVKCVVLKLSQGAKPGLGGVLPGAKVNDEVARVRGVVPGRTVVSPPGHPDCATPRSLVRFVARLRELSGGKPVGIKLCVGSRLELLALCKAMLEEHSAPDFIVVDGAEGGTGAAPLEFTDSVGMPLTDGLTTLHNALVGSGLRDGIKLGASGKIVAGSDIVTRLIQGADFTNSARAMLLALGCIQAQQCHTNNCPTGVATQDPRRARALDVADKAQRVRRYQEATVRSARQIMASLGAQHPSQLHTLMLRRRLPNGLTCSYNELYEWLHEGQLLANPPFDWAVDWTQADPDTFAPVPHPPAPTYLRPPRSQHAEGA
ncbi:FMN-binding glutamate synthase family protein [Streptomyces sp. NPDC090442]|uniref:FMN-binding glutamate synthase family protein n=1 Tax=Streptomyces sp. NPDC090442 TaxID=3365962 RepID=UPI003816ADB8